MVVRLLLALALALPASLRPAEAPAPLTRTALADFKPEPNKKVEDFFVVSIISLPFTALWSFVGAITVAAISQGRFPPEFDDPMLIGAGATALGAALSIGIISVSFGRGKPVPPTPQLPKDPQ